MNARYVRAGGVLWCTTHHSTAHEVADLCDIAEDRNLEMGLQPCLLVDLYYRTPDDKPVGLVWCETCSRLVSPLHSCRTAA